MKYKFAMTNTQKKTCHLYTIHGNDFKKNLIDNDFKFSTVDVKKFPE